MPIDVATVVLSERDAFLREMMRSILEEHNIDVRIASSDDEAKQMIDAKQPDLLLLEMMVPSDTSRTVLQHIQKQGYDFPVIVTTNTQLEESDMQSLGAREVIVKSDIDSEDLWTRVQRYLQPFRPRFC